MATWNVAAAVDSIIHSYGVLESSYSLYRRVSRAVAIELDEQSDIAPSDIEVSVALGRKWIQAEYDRAYALCGAPFADGDDIALTQLHRECFELHQLVIDLHISMRDSHKSELEPRPLHTPAFYATLEARRTQVTNILVQQRQRLLPVEISSQSNADHTIYFAFGSNMWFEQMANRCPGSRLQGKAILRGYRWQINQRGVANIVESQNDYVEGLVYSIDKDDEAVLDQFEGVKVGDYERRHLKVEYTPLRDGQLIPKAIAAAHPQQPFQLVESAAQKIEALTYISFAHVEDGQIRKEYIARMRDSVSDAITAGVSSRYIEHYLLPSIEQQRK